MSILDYTEQNFIGGKPVPLDELIAQDFFLKINLADYRVTMSSSAALVEQDDHGYVFIHCPWGDHKKIMQNSECAMQRNNREILASVSRFDQGYSAFSWREK